MRFLPVKIMVAAGLAAVATISIHSVATASAAADQPSSIVEDGAYPRAAEILQQQHVRLIVGDGRIMLKDCAEPPSGDVGLIEVYTTDLEVNGGGAVCFLVLGKTGFLSMEVPAVFEIRGDGQRPGTGHALTAVVQADGSPQPTTVEVNPSGSTQVGIGTDPPGAPTTLLELKVTG